MCTNTAQVVIRAFDSKTVGNIAYIINLTIDAVCFLFDLIRNKFVSLPVSFLSFNFFSYFKRHGYRFVVKTIFLINAFFGSDFDIPLPYFAAKVHTIHAAMKSQQIL